MASTVTTARPVAKSRVVTEPIIQQLAQANMANVSVSSEILDIAQGLDEQTRRKLIEAANKVLDNSEAISNAILSSPGVPA